MNAQSSGDARASAGLQRLGAPMPRRFRRFFLQYDLRRVLLVIIVNKEIIPQGWMADEYPGVDRRENLTVSSSPDWPLK